MVTVALAQELRQAGLRWHPAPGDRFVLPDRGMDGDVFVLSDMTIEVHEFPNGQVIGFNGTTEWALDSVEAQEALWLPREDQLRSALGGLFQRLDAGPPATVTIRSPDGEHQFTADEPAQAYGQALLSVLYEVTAAT